jgi:hypothetical protein
VNGLRVEVSEIVSNGFDSAANKYSCEGKISLTTATSDSAQLRSAFSSQAIAKGDGQFLVVVDQAGAIADALVDDFVAFARADAARDAQKPAATTGSTQPTTGVEEYAKDGARARLARSSGELTFEVSSSVGEHTCELEGKATFIAPDTAKYVSQDQDDRCSASFSLVPDGLTISTDGCSGACGMRADGSMDGTYKRTGQK